MKSEVVITIATLITGAITGGVILFRGVSSNSSHQPLQEISNQTQASLMLQGSDKVGICHYTGSETNPYEYIEVARSAVEGHRTHSNDKIDVKSEAECSNGGHDGDATTQVIFSTNTSDPTNTRKPTKTDEPEETSTSAVTGTPTVIGGGPTNTPDSTPTISTTSVGTTVTPDGTPTIGMTGTPEGTQGTPTIPSETPIPSALTLTAVSSLTQVSFTSATAPPVNETQPPTRTLVPASTIAPTITPFPTSTPSTVEVQLEELENDLMESKAQLVEADAQKKSLEEQLHVAQEALAGNISLSEQEKGDLNNTILKLQGDITVMDIRIKDLEKTISIQQDYITTLKGVLNNRYLQIFWAIISAIVSAIVSAIITNLITRARKKRNSSLPGQIPATTIKSINIISSVSRGSYLPLEIEIAPSEFCEPTLIYASGRVRTFPKDIKQAGDDGKLSWSLPINPNTRPGKWSVGIRCLPSGEYQEREFEVT